VKKSGVAGVQDANIRDILQLLTSSRAFRINESKQTVLFSPQSSGILRLCKRKLQLVPLHFASSSRQTAKAPAFAYARTDFAEILLKVLSETPIEIF